MSRKNSDFIKCAFCEWKTHRWLSRKDGSHTHGNVRLRNHVESAHPKEYFDIVGRSKNNYGGYLLNEDVTTRRNDT